MSAFNEYNDDTITLREVKQLLTKLLTRYSPDEPVTISIATGKESRTYDIIPKRSRKRGIGTTFAIERIPFSALEDTTETGTYLAVDNFTLAQNVQTPFYYALYINYDKVRDLRFFNDEQSAVTWLTKKVKALEKM